MRTEDAQLRGAYNRQAGIADREELRMRASSSEHLPLTPLLHAYVGAGLPSPGGLGRLAGIGPRFAAVLSASAKFLYAEFLDRASEADFTDAITRFYEAVVSSPLHTETLRRRAGFVRHGVGYLLRGTDQLPLKVENLLSPAGAYHVPGLGAAFWSALVQATQPSRLPCWTADTLAGLHRLGMARWRTGTGPGAVDSAPPERLWRDSGAGGRARRRTRGPLSDTRRHDAWARLVGTDAD